MNTSIRPSKILVTGGAGFIGSAVCRYFVAEGYRICNVDKLTYAANLKGVEAVKNEKNYEFVQADICDQAAMRGVFENFHPDAILHLAAESHVDRSINDASNFIQTNLVGTANLLVVATEYWRKFGCKNTFRFHHVSTDEVYGDLPLDDSKFHENTPYNPSSPYSASKAGSDFLVSAWHRTYGLPVIISNCSNNFGPFQHPEKLIPLIIKSALACKDIPVYGTGQNVRDWLHVDDHAIALEILLTRGRVGNKYNIGGNCERDNLTVVRQICSLLDHKMPQRCGQPYNQLITFVPDRPGHDLRYALDTSKMLKEFNWQPVYSFETGLEQTVDWYLANAV